MAQTLYDKLWNDHVVRQDDDGTCLLYIDRHLVHEVTSPQAFEGLRLAGRKPWRIAANLAVADHNVPTVNRDEGIEDPVSRLQVDTLDANCEAFGITEFRMNDMRQGIVHVIGPEQGATLPGMTVVCGDSHTSTHGAMAALAFGIGTSEVEHALATQTLVAKKNRNMLVKVEGSLPRGCTAKDLILHVIGVIGTAGGTGCTIEFAGRAIRELSIEGRMTVCNMAIEAGARSGLVAVDDKTIEYLRGRPYAPVGAAWDQAVAYWRTLHSDPGAHFDHVVEIDAAEITPQVSWGTSPEMVVSVTARVPDPEREKDDVKRSGMERALEYMGLKPNTPISDIRIDKVFIGSCTNSRIEDLRAAAEVARGKRVASNVRLAMVVPGSGLVKAQAEREGLDKIFLAAGFEWRDPGCSMCLAMNADRLEPGERCASTSNRNFEGRQGQAGAPIWSVRRWPPPPPSRATSSTCAPCANQESVMQAFTVHEGLVAPLDRENVDTDLIIPKQFLKSIKRTGFGPNLFDELRYLDHGEPGMDNSRRPLNPDFVLNQPRYQGATILLARQNFGCGSSREHAPWALQQYGFRAVIAPSFADIFFNNCYKTGLLPIVLSDLVVSRLFDEVKAHVGYQLRVDLERQVVIAADGREHGFDITAFRKHCLLNGLDEIGLTLQNADAIRAFEAERLARHGWLASRPVSL